MKYLCVEANIAWAETHYYTCPVWSPCGAPAKTHTHTHTALQIYFISPQMSLLYSIHRKNFLPFLACKWDTDTAVHTLSGERQTYTQQYIVFVREFLAFCPKTILWLCMFICFISSLFLELSNFFSVGILYHLFSTILQPIIINSHINKTVSHPSSALRTPVHETSRVISSLPLSSVCHLARIINKSNM